MLQLSFSCKILTIKERKLMLDIMRLQLLLGYHSYSYCIQECKFQKSQYRNKLKEKETLEKSLEIEKHFKVQENLKALHEYIKRLRVTQNEDMSITRRKSSKSERQTHRKSTSSKRNRREHNRSRLYENAQKLFEYQNP